MATQKMADVIKDGKIVASDAAILNAVRSVAPLTYQTSVPAATQGNISATLSALNAYTPNWDVFFRIFLGMFGRVIINDRFNFRNPLRKMKRAALTYGQNIEEIQANLVRARVYDPYDANVFGREGREPDIHVAFHTQNRTDKYEVNIPMRSVIQGGFTSDGSLGAFLNSLLAIPRESAENDEYEIANNLIDLYDKNEGFWNIQVPDFAKATSHTDAVAGAEALATAMRLTVRDFNFYGQATKFSPEGRTAGLKTRGIDPIAIIPNTVDAALAPKVLAYAFNRNDATLLDNDGSIITIDRFPAGLEAKGAQAIVVDRDWLMMVDTLGPLQLSSPMNPSNLSMNYFYHIWQIVSYSRFVPAVLFSTAASSTITDLTPTYSGVTLTDATGGTSGSIAAGAEAKLTATVTGTNGPNQAVRFGIATFNGKGKAYTLPADVFIDSTGIFHAGSVSQGDIIKVTATSLGDETKQASYTFTVA